MTDEGISMKPGIKSIGRLICSLVGAVSIAGCGMTDGREAASPIEKWRPKWAQLKDESKFAQLSDPETGDGVAIRCWPQANAAFACLRVAELGAVSGIMIAREDVGELPDFVLPYGSTDNGYSCGHIIEPMEEIQRRGQELVSNRIGYGRSQWSASFVRNYMADNDVKGTGWFPCIDVLRAVSSGSLATLSTTSVSRVMVGPA